LILTLVLAAKAIENKNRNDTVIVVWHEIVKGLL